MDDAGRTSSAGDEIHMDPSAPRCSTGCSEHSAAPQCHWAPTPKCNSLWELSEQGLNFLRHFISAGFSLWWVRQVLWQWCSCRGQLPRAVLCSALVWYPQPCSLSCHWQLELLHYILQSRLEAWFIKHKSVTLAMSIFNMLKLWNCLFWLFPKFFLWQLNCSAPYWGWLLGSKDIMYLQV